MCVRVSPHEHMTRTMVLKLSKFPGNVVSRKRRAPGKLLLQYLEGVRSKIPLLLSPPHWQIQGEEFHGTIWGRHPIAMGPRTRRNLNISPSIYFYGYKFFFFFPFHGYDSWTNLFSTLIFCRDHSSFYGLHPSRISVIRLSVIYSFPTD